MVSPQIALLAPRPLGSLRPGRSRWALAALFHQQALQARAALQVRAAREVPVDLAPLFPQQTLQVPADQGGLAAPPNTPLRSDK
jgi:hypothetical protein